MNTFACLRPVVACTFILGLAACGGGGGSTSETTVTIDPGDDVIGDAAPDDQTTTALRIAATGLLDTWAPTSPPVYTSLSAIPTTGTAEYAGYLFGDLSDSSDAIADSMIGTLTLEADLSASSATFSGTATGFIDGGDNLLDGTLTLSGGSLDRAGNPANDATIRGIDVAGTLTDTAGADLVFGLQLEGDFLGTAYNAIGGEVLGRVSVDGTDQDFDGGFIAER